MPNLPSGAVVAPCADLLCRVDSAYLDCVSDDLSLLLAARGVADVRTPFAVDWRFDCVEPADALPRLELPPADQDDLLARRTGWRPCWRPTRSVPDDLAEWHGALGQGSPVLLVGDAFHLPWLPYHEHEHMAHGFVLEGLEPAHEHSDAVAHVVDPYDNATQWGRATPMSTRLRLGCLTAALRGGRWAVLEPAGPAEPVDPVTIVLVNATAIVAAAEAGAYRRFVDHHRAAGPAELDNLTLQAWLLVRNRMLHGRWLAGLPSGVVCADLASRFVAEVASGWQRVSEMSYIALRRVRSGRPAPSAVVTTLRSVTDCEVSLARELLDGPLAGQVGLGAGPAGTDAASC